jgi:prevent-host-death family protein
MEVPVRELKNRLSEYLRRVAAGETLIVTSHRRPVARILPAEPPPLDEDEVIERLLAQPWISGGRGKLTRNVEPVKLLDPDVLASDIVLEGRD